MAYDGKILARARAVIDDKRHNNDSEREKREARAYKQIPELQDIDASLARLMADTATKALSGGNMKSALDSVRSECEAFSKRRAELLKKSGLPEDYTDMKYDCSYCRDTGYILGRPCNCLKDAYKAESVRELSYILDMRGQSFESFELDYYDNSKVKGGDSPRSIMSATYDFCKKYAYDFKDSSPNLLFRGSTGLGKTFLSACIAKVVSEKGFSVVYDTAVSVFDSFEAQKFDRGENSSEAASKVRRYLNCDLLIFDDLGTEMTTSFTQSAFYSLLNSRLISGLKTLISTNLTAEEIRRRYSAQIVSRLEGEYVCLEFVGRDIRAIKRERGLY